MPASRLGRAWAATCLAVLGGGCSGPIGSPLIDLPELAVLTATVPRGELVHLEVTNSTASEVLLSAPVCTARLELFRHGQWFAVPATNPDCVGVPVTLALGTSHRFGIPTPSDQAGRYRAVVTGSNHDGAFLVRSPAFTVE